MRSTPPPGRPERGASDAPEAQPGCLMCDSLYLKPDGSLPCWDDVGEDLILRQLDLAAVERGEEQKLFDFPALRDIRSAFLEGRLPHPGHCERCAVRHHGRAHSLSPKTMNVLHVEPTYLCQLACPQCFTPQQRLRDKRPPYYMSLEFFSGILETLTREGVDHIRFIHFEGRGDPLLHQDLGKMIALARKYFPQSTIGTTTHGNYPYRPWMIESGLDILRLSIDGAFEASYQKYRVGGTLKQPLALMRALRDAKRAQSNPLHIEWKYILFEWNDSDRELARAYELSQELEVHLRFCLTHSEGRSQRFQDAETLKAVLVEVAPQASYETTFQLRQEPSDGNSSVVLAEHVEALLLDAIDLIRKGRLQAARPYFAEALAGDPGEPGIGSEIDPLTLARPRRLDRLLCRHLETIRFPSTLSALANLALRRGAHKAAERLFERYLEVAPDAADRGAVEMTLAKLRAWPSRIRQMAFRLRNILLPGASHLRRPPASNGENTGGSSLPGTSVAGSPDAEGLRGTR